MKKVLFYPYYSDMNEYINRIVGLLKKKCIVEDYVEKRNANDYKGVDVIYLNWIESVLTEKDIDFICRAKNECGTKVIWVFHNKNDHELDNAQNKSSMESGKKSVIELSDIIIIHAKNSAELLGNYWMPDNKKIMYVPHINYNNEYENYVGNFRKILNIDDEKVIIGFLGLIRPYKNIELLIDAFKSVKSTDSILLIAGKCLDRDYYHRICEKVKETPNIIFKEGFISNAAMGSFLEAIDILALPYNKKSSMNSGSMIMAFSYAKTVIIPDIEMSNDFPKELMYDYCYENDEEHLLQLGNCIREAIRNGRGILRAKGKRIKSITDNYNSEEVVGNLLYNIIGIDTNDQNEDISIENEYVLRRSSRDYLYRVIFYLLYLYMNNTGLSDFFRQNDYESVAIYGMGRLGHLIYDDLIENGIDVAYCIDANPKKYKSANIRCAKEDLDEVDLIIITVEDINGAKEALNKLKNTRMLGLLDIINCLMINNKTYKYDNCFSIDYGI